MLNYISGFFSKGHNRSLIVKKNIFYSLIIKGGSIAISLVLIPLTIRFVNETQYGLWLTLSSIIGWFSFFDIGLGNGLKTRLTEAISKGDFKQGKTYVSTTYAALSILSISLLILFSVMQLFVDWSKILNAPASYAPELSGVAWIVFISFTFQFVLNLIIAVAAANQNTVVGSLVNLVGNLITITAVYFLTKFYVTGTLLQLAVPMCLSSILVLLIFSIILYQKRFRAIAPSISFVDFSCLKDVAGLGLKFFIIQMGLILYYNIDNMVITQILGPKEVTPYAIAYKYFGVITMFSAIVMTPLWTAFAEAHAKQDYNWIKMTVRKMQLICLALVPVGVVMVLISPYVYKFWVGEEIEIPMLLSAILAFYTIWNTFRTIFIYYLNGVGVIKLQVYLVLLSGLANVPLAIILAKLMGTSGVILSTTILCIICGIIEIIQYRKLINQKAQGLWMK
jgi:O-antigen/teichoic acid export membrane protein